MFLGFVIPVIGFLVNVIIQILSFRYLLRRKNLLKSEIFGFIFGLCLTFLSILLQNDIWLLIVNLLIYSALGYCYFHFVNLGETARRIRILREVHDSADGLTLDEILGRYGAREIVERRMERLLRASQIIEKGGKYFVSSFTMIVIARIILVLKWVILGKSSEFDT